MEAAAIPIRARGIWQKREGAASFVGTYHPLSGGGF